MYSRFIYLTNICQTIWGYFCTKYLFQIFHYLPTFSTIIVQNWWYFKIKYLRVNNVLFQTTRKGERRSSQNQEQHVSGFGTPTQPKRGSLVSFLLVFIQQVSLVYFIKLWFVSELYSLEYNFTKDLKNKNRNIVIMRMQYTEHVSLLAVL